MNGKASSFLADVLANPDDDMPRLAYADWLSEHGDPRGEFIRTQCLLARLDELKAEYYDLWPRNYELLDQFGEEWADELEQDLRKAEFHRGFVDTITIRARVFLEEADELFDTVPIHWLRFNYMSRTGAKLAKLPALSSVRHLNLSGLKIDPDELSALLSSPHLSNLESLKVSHLGRTLSGELARCIGSSAFATKLKRLSATGIIDNTFVPGLSGITLEQLEELAIGTEGNKRLTGLGNIQTGPLKKLKMRGRTTVADLQEVARLPIQSLETLDLAGTGVPAKGLQSIATSGALNCVKNINLSQCNLPLRAAQFLLSGDNLASCEMLKLGYLATMAEKNQIIDLMESIDNHTTMCNLKDVHLSAIDGPSWGLVANTERFANLQRLVISECHLTTASGDSISRSGWRKGIKSLALKSLVDRGGGLVRLSSAEFPELLSLRLDGGIETGRLVHEPDLLTLLNSDPFPALRSLSLDRLGITDKTLQGLLEVRSLQDLRMLSFVGNRFNEKTVRQLFECPNLPNLKHIVLTDHTGSKTNAQLKSDLGPKIDFSYW